MWNLLGQIFELSYLCTRPENDDAPSVFVSTQLKGATLKSQLRSNFVLGVPVQTTLLCGLMFAVASIVLCTLRLNTAWIAGIIGVVVGFFTHFLCAVVYKAERWLKYLIER